MPNALLFLASLASTIGGLLSLRSDLPPIAKKYAAAIGAPAHVPAVEAVRRTWRVHRYGLEGTLIDELGPQRARRHLGVGPLDETLVVEGARLSRRDANGRVAEPNGLDRADLVSTLSVDTGAWLFDATKITVLSPDNRRQARIRLELPAPVELTFAASGDLVRRRILRGTEAEDTQYDDWATVAGQRLARHAVVHERNIKEPYEQQLVKAEAIAMSAPFPALVQREDVHFPVGQERIELPLSLINERWMLTSVVIGGRSALFLIDTGASSTIVDTGFAERMGLRLEGTGTQEAGIFTTFHFVRSPAMSVGGVGVDPQLLLALDIEHSPLGLFFPGVVGILGYDFVSRFVMVVDYPSSRLSFVTKDKFKPRPDDAVIPCIIDGTNAIVDVRLAGRASKFLVDTGSGGGILVEHVTDQKKLVSTAAQRFYDPAGSQFGSGAATGTWPARAELGVGPFVWKEAPITVVDESSAKGTSFEQGGNLGAQFLRHFRMSIDIGGGRLWLSQQIPFRDRDVATFGLQVDSQAGKRVVRSMAVDGPAARAGVKAGDELVSVNGLQASGGALPERALLDPTPNERVVIGVMRAKALRTFELHAEALPH